MSKKNKHSAPLELEKPGENDDFIVETMEISGHPGQKIERKLAEQDFDITPGCFIPAGLINPGDTLTIQAEGVMGVEQIMPVAEFFEEYPKRNQGEEVEIQCQCEVSTEPPETPIQNPPSTPQPKVIHNRWRTFE
jgi:hypothetical protein